MKIEPDRLVKEELEYEIKIRGILPTGNVKELTRTLRDLLTLENEGHSFSMKVEFDAESEIRICQEKLVDLESLIKAPLSEAIIRKLKSKLGHLVGRCERITSNDKETIEIKAKLLTDIFKYVSRFRKLCEEHKGSSEPLDIQFQQSLITSTPNRSSSNATENQSASGLPVLMNNLNLNKRVNFSSWGLTFSGDSDTMGLNAFLERIEELCEAHNVSHDDLFRGAIEIFEGKALIFYRALKGKVNDWKTLCEHFREEFLPRDYTERLWEQIKTRTQGEKESITIYVAYMTNLFNRCSASINEAMKLKILRKNILPFYQTQLGLVDISTVDELIKLCKRIEDSRVNVLNFVPPTVDKHSVEPDLLYKANAIEKQSRKRLDSLEAEKQVSFNLQPSNKQISNNKSRNYSSDRESTDRNAHLGRNREISNDRLNRGSVREQDRRTGTVNKWRDGSYDRGRFYRNRSNDRSSSVESYNGDRSYQDRSRERHNTPERYYNKNRLSRDINNDYFDYYRAGNQPRENSFNRGRSSGRDRSDLGSYREHRNSRYDSYNRDLDNNTRGNVVKCYRCNGDNHLARHCKAQVKKCFSCGLLGYTKVTCPKCNKQGNGSRS